jgi:hypothetical protein
VIECTVPENYVYDAFGNLAAEYGGTVSTPGTQYLTTAGDSCAMYTVSSGTQNGDPGMEHSMSKNILVRPGKNGCTDLEIGAVIVDQSDPYGVYVLDERIFDMREIIEVTPLNGGCIVNTSRGKFHLGMIRENYDDDPDVARFYFYMRGKAISALLVAASAAVSNGLALTIPDLVRTHNEGGGKGATTRKLTLNKKNIVLQWPRILGRDSESGSLTGEVLAELTDVVSYNKKSWREDLTLNLEDGSLIEIKNGPSFFVNVTFNLEWETVATTLNIPRV